jgi:small basic protein (TIGR04137 family)
LHCLPAAGRLGFALPFFWEKISTDLKKPFIMSQHRSLKGASTITVKRNVLKRFERVELLKKRGVWKADQSVIGLPKTAPEA